MKTRDEVEALKREWLADSEWELAEADGYEEYAEELAAFELAHMDRLEREQKDAIAARSLALAASNAVPMTPRDWFAAALVSGSAMSSESADGIARRAYLIADAMLLARTGHGGGRG